MKPTSRLPALCSVAAALALAAVPAHAEQRGAGTVYDRISYPYGERVNQPLTLPATLIRAEAPIAVNLSKDRVGEPVNVPVALDYGVLNGFQVGLFHDTGLCLTGTSNGCSEVYDDVGGRVRIGLSRTPESQLAAEVSLLAYQFDDPRYLGTLALAYKRSVGNIGVLLDAGLRSALNARSDLPFTESAFAEAEGAIQLGESLSVFGRLGVNRPLDTESGYSARTSVPVTLGAEIELVRKLVVGAQLGFPNLLGEDATADDRELMILLRLFV